MSSSPSLSKSKNATPPPMVSMRNRSGDSPLNWRQLMPASSVMSVKISLEAEAVAGMGAVFQNAAANIRKTIAAIVPALGIEIQSRLRVIGQQSLLMFGSSGPFLVAG